MTFDLTNKDPSKVRIFIIRHGQTDHNVKKIIQGHVNIGLNQTGINQARLVGQRFKTVSLDGVWTSDLSRCRDTVEEILVYHPELKHNLQVTADLRERNMGKAEGLHITEAISRYGPDFRNLGEKKDVLIKRINDQWHRIIEDSAINGGTNYVMCTHGGAITAFSGYLYEQGYLLADGLTKEKLKVPFNTSVTIIDVDKNTRKGIFQVFGDTSHLGEQLEVKDQELR